MAGHLWLLRLRPDDDRELTDRGREQSLAAGRALAALGLEFHDVFTSPKVRARETAASSSSASSTPNPARSASCSTGSQASA